MWQLTKISEWLVAHRADEPVTSTGQTANIQLSVLLTWIDKIIMYDQCYQTEQFSIDGLLKQSWKKMSLMRRQENVFLGPLTLRDEVVTYFGHFVKMASKTGTRLRVLDQGRMFSRSFLRAGSHIFFSCCNVASVISYDKEIMFLPAFVCLSG